MPLPFIDITTQGLSSSSLCYAFALALHIAHVFRSVGQQRHEARLLQGGAQAALMFRACPRLAPGFNLATIRNVAFHETTGVLVVDFTHVIVAELAYFAARRAFIS